MKSPDAIHVAVAAIVNSDDEVFIALRPDHVHQGGLWEFPGGKVEAHEDVSVALVRELKEEVGIDVRSSKPLIQIHHDYGDKHVWLDVHLIHEFGGEPHGREGQEVRWVAKQQLRTYTFPQANYPIISALLLPDRYLITPEPGANLGQFLQRLESRLQGGIKMLQLRAKRLSTSAYRELAQRVLALCERYDVKLILNSEPELVEQIGAHGVHLSSARLLASRSRPLSSNKWVAVSCHNQEEIEQANKIQADFAVLGPVLATASHPDAPGMGWYQFALMCELANYPVYALGGMLEEHISEVQSYGGHGIAAIRALWWD
ncbi:Nudix family hydrolase [Kaarinaea lacus]